MRVPSCLCEPGAPVGPHPCYLRTNCLCTVHSCVRKANMTTDPAPLKAAAENALNEALALAESADVDELARDFPDFDQAMPDPETLPVYPEDIPSEPGYVQPDLWAAHPGEPDPEHGAGAADPEEMAP